MWQALAKGPEIFEGRTMSKTLSGIEGLELIIEYSFMFLQFNLSVGFKSIEVTLYTFSQVPLSDQEFPVEVFLYSCQH